MLTALIDADVVAYQAASSAEQVIQWDDDLWTLHAFTSDAEQKFDEKITAIQVATGADKVVLAFTDDVNWRKSVLPTYKSNRAATRKPMHLKHLKERAMDQYESFLRPTLEGDDCIGILATRKGAGDVVICSIDKDFKTIPGRIYNFDRKEYLEITEAEADYWHLMQTLTGDTTDGYAGCPGIGPKTAEKILDPFMNDGQFDLAGAWEAVVATYVKAKLNETEALVQARVARICRASDYDFKKKEPILWNPDTK